MTASRPSMAGIPWQLVSALALALLLVGLPGAPGARAASANWAWLIVRTTGDHTPDRRDRANSSGAVDSVVDLSGLLGPGAYGIQLTDVGPNDGQSASVLVSTLGTKPRICAPYDWTVINDDVDLTVLCFTRTGAPAPATFIVNWLAASGTGGRLAYAANLSPTGKCGPAPRQYQAQGSTIIKCDDQGIASLSTGTIGSEGGNVQLSAFARRQDSGTTPSAGFCSVAAFPAGGVQSVCFEAGGETRITRGYTMWLMNGLGLKGIVRTSVAYAYANRPKRGSYRPPAEHRYSSSGKTPRIERLGKGRYRVTLPGLPVRGSAQVTPFAAKDGSGMWVPRHCVIASIATTLPQRVGVRCFDAAGDPADSRFMLAYAK